MSKKLIKLFIALVVIIAVNCTHKYKETPEVGTSVLRLAEADYSIGQETSGQACGWKFLGLVNFKRIFSSDSGKMGLGGPSFLNFEDGIIQEARFDALSKLEGATFIVNPKLDTELKDYLVATKLCATIKAKGITLKNGPLASK
ncbi:MAG: hypothetical protein MH321_11065 [Leptospiraceae bacterium]|nr:hypothetical protein [Leptospiraceae bacterium]